MKYPKHCQDPDWAGLLCLSQCLGAVNLMCSPQRSLAKILHSCQNWKWSCAIFQGHCSAMARACKSSQMLQTTHDWPWRLALYRILFAGRRQSESGQRRERSKSCTNKILEILADGQFSDSIRALDSHFNQSLGTFLAGNKFLLALGRFEDRTFLVAGWVMLSQAWLVLVFIFTLLKPAYSIEDKKTPALYLSFLERQSSYRPQDRYQLQLQNTRICRFMAFEVFVQGNRSITYLVKTATNQLEETDSLWQLIGSLQALEMCTRPPSKDQMPRLRSSIRSKISLPGWTSTCILKTKERRWPPLFGWPQSWQDKFSDHWNCIWWHGKHTRRPFALPANERSN